MLCQTRSSGAVGVALKLVEQSNLGHVASFSSSLVHLPAKGSVLHGVIVGL